MVSNTSRLPVAFVSHGGGPSFFIDAKPGDRMYDIGKGSEAEKSLQRLPKQLGAEKPSAIVVISAHWEGSDAVLIAAKNEYTKLYYDYGGFPKFTYELEYRAPANPTLARHISTLLQNNGIPSALDTTRNWDHGLFVPLMVMFPEANIPVVEVSILESYDPKTHLAIGKALAPLRDQGVLIIGSGYATHTFGTSGEKNFQFVNAVSDIVQNATPEERLKAFEQWEKIPAARAAHRQEDHFMPMLVVVGAAGEDKGKELYKTGTIGGSMAFAHWGFGV